MFDVNYDVIQWLVEVAKLPVAFYQECKTRIDHIKLLG
ncbi:hypothetical protein CZ809_00204 [Photobacterium piscicola]|uniref:Uncharacterized protein n=1 Tax=Photobacterium piscicola TaxID=1378299 RepID=A0A1T5HV66_9GAMM|nr:hypothetical protein CZ809_00204 [Photobacterium piscicola]